MSTFDCEKIRTYKSSSSLDKTHWRSNIMGSSMAILHRSCVFFLSHYLPSPTQIRELW